MASTQVHYNPAAHVSCRAAEDIAAGLLVVPSADFDGRNPVVSMAKAGAHIFGVMSKDVKKGSLGVVLRPGHIVDVAATGAIAAGDPVAAGAAGKAVKAADSAPIVGIAVSKAANNVVSIALK